MRAPTLAWLAFLALLSGCAGPESGTAPEGDGDSVEGSPAAQPTPASPAFEWAAPQAATIRPGVLMTSELSQCTSNFVFTSPDNQSVFLGFAAHCVDQSGDVTDQDGCDATAHPPMPLGSPVEVEGASKPAFLAYTSWGAMQAAGETDPDTCRFNDFAVARLDPADHGSVSPAMLHFGGPTGLADVASVQRGDKVLAYGASPLRLGLAPLSPHEGYVLAAEANGWTTVVYTVTPGVPGDSGSGVLLGNGLALGDMVTLEATPLPLSNRVSTLAYELDYAREVAGFDLRLATWDVMDSGLLPPGPV